MAYFDGSESWEIVKNVHIIRENLPPQAQSALANQWE